MSEIYLFSDSWHVISAVIVFVIGFIITIKSAPFFSLGQKGVAYIYFYHTIFCLLYLLYILKNGGDATTYFFKGAEPLADFKPGTMAVVYLISFLYKFKLSFLGMFLVFNILGVIGLLAFYSALNRVTLNSSPYLRRLVLITVFLPSVSFWSAGLGKDAISFMAIGLALYAALDFRKHLLLLSFAILIMLLVRPHIAGMMVIAISISVFLQKDIPVIPKSILGGLSLAGMAVLVPFALNYAGLESDASDLESYIDKRQGYNQRGGGGVDISSMSLPMQMATYIVRPFPFEARSISQLLASIDNVFLLVLLFMGLKAKVKYKNLTLVGNRAFMWSYVGICWVLLSMTTANLGIAMRQKWMFVPILLFLLISIIAAAESKKVEHND
ncbi:hypothetical protein AB4238_05160 [Shewanella sp. 10N.286.45.A1]|uniref:hypothetical protein n=1 Tax=Shewanella sp. 10N.286.45.A1 TaxID=3229694 RepID=UPI003553D36C